MARFRFRLQPVLDHKRRLEDLAQIELAQFRSRQLEEEGSLNRLNDAENNAVNELERQRFTGRLNIEALQIGMGYLDLLKIQIQRQAQIVERAQQATETKRQQLVGHMQERKVMEKLRERQLQDFVHEQNRAEAREVDEIVVMRHGWLQGQASVEASSEARAQARAGQDGAR